MNGFSRALLALAAAAVLGGCNMVVSERPWFAAPSGPQLKKGIWAMLDTADCSLDPAAALPDWPDCARPVLVRGGEYLGPAASDDDRPPAERLDPARWDKIVHVLADGTPQIDQIISNRPVGGGPPVDGVDTDKPFYIYTAVQPTATDSAGRITALRRWPVLCGPKPPRKQGLSGRTRFVTDKPFKGLVVKGDSCGAKDIPALRRAAAGSEAIAAGDGFSIIISRWVRDYAP
ncbi:hypothetical protein [Novosphingobium sp.]|uniref:hypothetical protein n=1 Tax=Novosphingobium sp. TaxID=1874826 RepID=UPI0027365B0E|nr:hypothetical protein [Novosphingobium sp.]MDP3907210.1 hypothetical protein [Novosphingobium sp.]